MEVKRWVKGKIALPGIYSNMPMERYHDKNVCVEPSISSSGLRTIWSKSPAHYWVTSPHNPDRLENEEETEALLLGRAAHHLLYGQDDFEAKFAIAKDMLDPKTGERKPFHMGREVCKIWAENRRQEGKSILRLKHIEAINGMAESLKNHALVKGNIKDQRHGILDGLIETSWFIKHKATGYWLRARPDAAPTDSLMFVDLKTTTSVDWHSLRDMVYRHGYFIQAGVTAMVVKELLNQYLESFHFLFIEKTPPYDIAVVTLKENEIARGIRAAEKALTVFAECMHGNRWPGRYTDQAVAQYIEMPEWAQKQIDERLSRDRLY